MIETYYLYLDESETHDTLNKAWINKVFALVGFIIKKADHDTLLTNDLNALKAALWHDLPKPSSYILHEMDVKFAQNNKNAYKLQKINSEYRRFRSSKYSNILYKGLKKIILSNNIKTMGAVVVDNELKRHYNKSVLTDQYLIATQIILENYCHFLQQVNGVGYVIYESRLEQDRDVRMRINQIKAMGTMYISPYAIQERIINVEFFNKFQNVTGLQIADFMPNSIARKTSETLYGKKLGKFTLYQPIRKMRYDGGIGLFDRFGIKTLP